MSDPTPSGQNLPIGLPDINSPFVEINREISRPWYQFLRQLYLRTGGAMFTLVNAVVDTFGVFTLTANGVSSAVITGTENASGNVLQSTRLIGSPAVVLTLVTSPFVFIATAQGLLVVFGGQLDISRDNGGTWVPVGLVGGALPMLTNDRARITWFSSLPPPVTFLPST